MQRRWASLLVWVAAATMVVFEVSTGTSMSLSPPVVDASSTQRIALGDNHSCAIRSDDVIVCWGENQYEQFPRPPGASGNVSTVPVEVAPLGEGLAPRRITAGASHTCVLAIDGTVWCWGNNGAGQLGIGNNPSTATPSQVTLVSTARLVAAGGQTTCAVLDNNEVWCWGLNNTNQLGIGSSTTNSSIPVKADFPAGTVVTSIDVGTSHVCAGDSAGALWCWGLPNEGRLGVTFFSNVTSPTATQLFTGSVAVPVTGGSHTCALVGSEVKCFGNNAHGQLGVSLGGSATSTATPQQVMASGAIAVAAGESHTCIALSSSVSCAGQSFTGLQSISGLSGSVVDVAAGASHSCAVTGTGTVLCWGTNTKGQLGTGDTADRTTATAVGSLNIGTTTTSTTTTTTTTTSTSTTLPNLCCAPPTTTTMPPAPTTTVPGGSTFNGLTVRRGRTVSALAVVKAVKMKVPAKGKGTMRISIMSGTRYCTFKGTAIKGVRQGRCTIRVMLIPRNGKTTSKRIVIRVV